MLFWSFNYFLSITLNLIHILILNSILNGRASFTATRDSLSFEICPFTPKNCILLISQTELGYKKNSGNAVLSWCPVKCQMAFYSHRRYFLGEPQNKVIYQHCQQTLQERNLQPPGRIFQIHLQKAAKTVWIIWWLNRSQAVLPDPRSAGKDGAVAVSLELTLLPWSWARLESKYDKRLKLLFCCHLFFFF